MDLTLYFAPGACSRVPMIVLEEIGCPFDVHLVAFMRGDHRAPTYLALNPAGKVPVLEVDGVAIAQNTAILMCLAGLFPDHGLLPAGTDPVARAQALAQLVWFSADLHPLVTRIRMPQFFCDLAGAPERVRAMGETAMAMQLHAINARLGQQPWVLGDRWSALDAYLYWVWFRITGAGFDAAPFAALARHAARMETRPAVQRVLQRENEALATLESLGLTVKLSQAGARS